MVDKHAVLEQARKLFEYVVNDVECDLCCFKPEEIKEVKDKVNLDLQFFYDSDPAANNLDEIKITYPGFKAIVFHRIANVLYKKDKKLVARIIAEQAHLETGIDINPGATIGAPFFIDHGTGVVIGETAIVGNYVKMYQGVTLGALAPDLGQVIKGTKRHPTIGNNVTIYANASIIGDITIGNNVKIGGNVFLLESIQDNCKVTNPKPILVITEKK